MSVLGFVWCELPSRENMEQVHDIFVHETSDSAVHPIALLDDNSYWSDGAAIQDVLKLLGGSRSF